MPVNQKLLLMKFLIAIVFSVTMLLGLDSCQKPENIFCYECTHPSQCSVDICNETVTPENNGICVLAPNQSGSTNLEYKNAYENDGYTCRIK